ncbi:MAG: hypothetical protein GY750_09235 [Lentisphaerae bacterium]|nr:hypothetical protein [Lentisphaerota bacterium]MCP4101595.1 hypothetical protein [Lentisphaerota bacterium]
MIEFARFTDDINVMKSNLEKLLRENNGYGGKHVRFYSDKDTFYLHDSSFIHMRFSNPFQAGRRWEKYNNAHKNIKKYILYWLTESLGKYSAGRFADSVNCGITANVLLSVCNRACSSMHGMGNKKCIIPNSYDPSSMLISDSQSNKFFRPARILLCETQKNKGCNMSKMPKVENVPNNLKLIAMGDTHSSAMKMVYLLIKYNIFSCTSYTYFQLQNAYKQRDFKDYKDYKDYLSHLKKNNTANHLLLLFLGDTLADRGESDLMVLYCYEFLSKNDIDYKIIFSNHDLEFYLNYKKSSKMV